MINIASPNAMFVVAPTIFSRCQTLYRSTLFKHWNKRSHRTAVSGLLHPCVRVWNADVMGAATLYLAVTQVPRPELRHAWLQQPVICLIPGCGCGLMTGPPAGTGSIKPLTARYRLAAGDMQLQGCCTRRFDETALTGMFHDEYLSNYLTYDCNFYTRMWVKMYRIRNVQKVKMCKFCTYRVVAPTGRIRSFVF